MYFSGRFISYSASEDGLLSKPPLEKNRRRLQKIIYVVASETSSETPPSHSCWFSWQWWTTPFPLPLPLPTTLSPQGAHGEGTTSRGAVVEPYAPPLPPLSDPSLDLCKG